MTYTDYEIQLNEAYEELPREATATLHGTNIITIIGDIGTETNLTMGEIGELCELVRQVITKELPVEKFEESLKEKLADDEDNLPRAAEIVWEVGDKIFSKLLPALGIAWTQPPKPIPATPATAVESAAPTASEAPQETPARPVPLKKIFPPPRAPFPPQTSNLTDLSTSKLTPIPPQPLSEFSSVRASPTYQSINLKTNLSEPSHERLSDNPTDSFLKMLSGKISEKELQSRFDKLPYTLKTALRSVDSAKKVVDIGRKYALHVDKLGELGAETGLVILGITHPAQFLPRLTRRLGTSEEKVRPIAQEINTEIFLKIREALKQINGEPVAQAAAPLRPPPQPKYQGEALIKQHPPPLWSGQSSPPSQLSNLRTSDFQTSTLAPESEEVLDREAILRDIENPTPTRSVTSVSSVENLQAAPETPPNLPGETEAPPFITETISQPKKPPEIYKGSTFVNSAAQQRREMPALSTPRETPPVTEKEPSPQKASMSEALAPEAPQPLDIVDQKLSATVASPKSESQYTMDPYREPLA